MKILCTHPGRYGDCLWALPTVRAIAESYQAEVDVLLSPRLADQSFRQLLGAQLYLHDVRVAEDWAVLETAPMTPRVPPSLPSGYDVVVHLGYDGWPEKTLPQEIYRLATAQGAELTTPLALDRPWLAAPYPLQETEVAVGFSDEWFELKFGLYWLLRERFVTGEDIERFQLVNLSGGPRWTSDRGHRRPDWQMATSWIAGAQVFVGCCSALHVLACAVGTPVVLVEPNSQRHHDVFYPYGKSSGTQVYLVTGNDGLPTFDARHVIDAVAAVLARQELRA